MEELNLSEQMSINGGGINASMVWYNLYGAFAKHYSGSVVKTKI